MFEPFHKKKKRPSGGQAFMADGSNSRHCGGWGGAVNSAGAVAETTAVAVATVGAAAQAAQEPQAHAENSATSATVINIFGVST